MTACSLLRVQFPHLRDVLRESGIQCKDPSTPCALQVQSFVDSGEPFALITGMWSNGKTLQQQPEVLLPRPLLLPQAHATLQ